MAPMDSPQRALLARRGAVAETCGILFADNGRPLWAGLQKRTIAVTEQQLRRAGDVVALATGARRAAAVRALTRAWSPR